MSVLDSQVISLGNETNSCISLSRDMAVCSPGSSWFWSSIAVSPRDVICTRAMPFSSVNRHCSTAPKCISVPFTKSCTRDTSANWVSEKLPYAAAVSWL